MMLFDNDVIHKLGSCDLLDNVFSLISPLDDIYVLDTAKYVLKGITKKKQGGKICYTRIEQFLSKTKNYITPNIAILSQLNSVKNIDGGEAILIEGLVSHQSSLFFTGDKRCLEALASSEFYRFHISQVTEKIICFEQIILWLIYKLGFEKVNTKIFPARDCDKMLKAIFTSSSTQESVIEGLNSYIIDLRKDTGCLLCLRFNYLLSKSPHPHL